MLIHSASLNPATLLNLKKKKAQYLEQLRVSSLSRSDFYFFFHKSGIGGESKAATINTLTIMSINNF